ncbi:MAG TPA: prolyl oligopeptidase family serine peptidase [Kofleriaceae bacterium]|nr:prolyl oligopeptidase family serine peptidase [Kofleriaceae bacterium]
MRLGDLGDGSRGVLAEDARALAGGDAAGPGPEAVIATGLRIGDFEDGIAVSIYRPKEQHGRAPAVVFLPGRVAPESQYESYARALASRGFVVAVRGWYSFFHTDEELARDAQRIARWLVTRGLADRARIGVAGHSMGGKDAILAAADAPDLFHAVVAIDPDDNGRHSVVNGPVGTLKAALLLVGAEVAWKGARVCAPLEHNYQRFFARAPAGTVELTLRGADHVQVMDRPDGPGMGLCRVGTADSRTVRTLSRAATVRFFEQHLRGLAGAPLLAGDGAQLRTKGAAGLAQPSETLNARNTPVSSRRPSPRENTSDEASVRSTWNFLR